MRILIVEDELLLAEALGEILRGNQMTVDIVNDGSSGYEYGLTNLYDVIVLDIMLPGFNGFEIVKKLRNEKITTPILLLTAKDETSDKVTGLDLGADDYLTKPFDSEELLARIRALSRRQGIVCSNKITYGDITLDLSTASLFKEGKSVHLGLKEFDVLRLLILNAPSCITKESLLTKIWGMDSNAEDNNVEVYISFLRKKLAYVSSTVTIETIRKLGYHLSF